MRRLNAPYVVHLVCLAFFPFLFLFTHNLGQAMGQRFVTGVLVPGAITSACAIGLSWLVGRLLGDRLRGGLIVSLSLVAFFAYGHVYHLVEGMVIGNVPVGRHLFVLPLWSILFVVGVVVLGRAKTQVVNVTAAANLVGVVLVTFSALQIALHEYRTIGGKQGSAVAALPTVADGRSSRAALPNELPDIYYVILDAYAGRATLAELYDQDNGPFLQALERRGFYVAGDAASNYASTFLSVASSLNMEYVHEKLHGPGSPELNWMLLAQRLKDSAVLRFVRARGYRYVHLRSGADGVTDYNPFADRNVSCGRISEYWSLLLQTTLAKVVDNRLGFLADDARGRVLCQFRALADIASLEGPKFVFAHLLVPHPPFLFGEDGKPIPGASLSLTDDTVWKDRLAYRNQLRFTNTRTLELVDRILAVSPRPPVIVIHGDHGPLSLGWRHPGPALFRERMRILNAYHLPGHRRAPFYPSISPVNTFRAVFNEYFDGGYPLLPDRAYFSDGNDPYVFQDVTQWLQ